MSSEGPCSPAGQETGILRSRLLLLTIFLPLPPSCSPSALAGGSFHVETLGLLLVCRNSGSLFPYCSFGFLFSPSDACFLCLSSSIACEFHLVSCKHLRVGFGWEWEMGSLGPLPGGMALAGMHSQPWFSPPLDGGNGRSFWLCGFNETFRKHPTPLLKDGSDIDQLHCQNAHHKPSITG